MRAAAGMSPPVLVVYAGGVMTGLVLVSVPALSAVLTAQLGLSDAEYGALFLPQLVFATLGAVGGGMLARRLGLKTLLLAALAAYVLAQTVLALSGVLPAAWAYPATLVATAGLGFGIGVHGAPLNTWPAILFPRHAHAAVVVVHMVIGLGLAVGPLLAAPFVEAGIWFAWPAVLAAASLALLVASAAIALPPEPDAPPAAANGGGAHPATVPVFWLFAANGLLYALAEGIFSNWAVLFLSEGRGLDETVAGVALSVFWGSLVAGRLGGSMLLGHVPPRRAWAALPVAMAAAFLVIPLAHGPVAGIAVFAFAGLACSVQFPLTISLAAEAFPRHVSWVSSMLIACVMIGIGSGSFLIGALREWLGFDTLYRLCAVFPLLMLLLSIPVLRRHTPR